MSEDRVTREVTAAEAFSLKLKHDALNGDDLAADILGNALEQAEQRRGQSLAIAPKSFRVVGIRPGSVGPHMEILKIVKKLYALRDNAYYLIELWIVEKALDALGSKRLPLNEQKIVTEPTRTPKK